MKKDFCKGHIKIRHLPPDFNGSGRLEVEVANQSKFDWKSEITDNGNYVRICYHWLNEKWDIVTFDGTRTDFIPSRLAAGTSAVFHAEIRAPEKIGVYYLIITLLSEGKFWFDGAEDFRMEAVKIQIKKGSSRKLHPEKAGISAKNLTEGVALPGEDSAGFQSISGLVSPSVLDAIKEVSDISTKPFEKGRNIGFMHIPKTSGSAMIALLVKAANLKSYYKEGDLSHAASLTKKIEPELPIGESYLAHVSLSTLLKGCPGGQYLTVFREPITRILSHWLFWRGSSSDLVPGSSEWNDHLIRTQAKLVDVLLDPMLACNFDNQSLRMLVYPHEFVPDVGFIERKNDGNLLLHAFERLKKFAFLDVVENPQFEENLQNWLQTDLIYNRVNVTGSMPERLRTPLHYQFTPEALDALEERSRLDRVLWSAIAATRMPGVDLERVIRAALIENIARYSAIML